MSEQFDRLGFPGKYHSAKTWTGGQLDLTGSNYGYGAFLRSGSNTNGTITVAGGATIAINNFEENRILDVSLHQVSGSSAGDGEIYLFKRQQ
jgi:hypothetical protein